MVASQDYHGLRHRSDSGDDTSVLRAEYGALRSTVGELQRHVEGLVENRRSHHHENQRIEQELERERGQAQELHREIREVRGEVQHAKQDLAHQKGELEQMLERKLTSTTSDTQRQFQTELGSLRQEVVEKTDLQGRMQEFVDPRLKDQVDPLNEQVRKLQQELGTAERRLEATWQRELGERTYALQERLDKAKQAEEHHASQIEDQLRRQQGNLEVE